MDLLKLSKKFYKLASLKTDMANRIMYGITSQMAETIDYPVLELAVAGAKDVIKYGINACYDELEHYRGGISYDNLPDFDMYKNSEINSNTLPAFISYLELFEEFFNDDKKWYADHGGKAWANIAKTLKILAENYLKYLTTKKYSKENLQSANDTIIYLNVFDGLAHNTSGIYTSLIEEEENVKKIHTDYKEIEELMHSKELINPVDTYNMIKKNLGIDLPYKDYIQKLRQDPEFFKRDPEKVKKEIDEISFIRYIKSFFYDDELLNKLLNKINTFYNSSMEKINILYSNPIDQNTINQIIDDMKFLNAKIKIDILYFYFTLRDIQFKCERNKSNKAAELVPQLEDLYNNEEYQNKILDKINQKFNELNIDNVKTTVPQIKILLDTVVDLITSSINEYKSIRNNI